MNLSFRVWLSSSPIKQFPVQIIKNSIKVTSEPPRGLKANLTQIYREIDKDRYFDMNQAYKKLFFATSFFHTIIQERKNFGSLGWNIKYDWMLSDLWTSNFQLEDQSQIKDVPIYSLI